MMKKINPCLERTETVAKGFIFWEQHLWLLLQLLQKRENKIEEKKKELQQRSINHSSHGAETHARDHISHGPENVSAFLTLSSTQALTKFQ